MTKHTTNLVSLNIQFRHMPSLRPIRELVELRSARLSRFHLGGGYCDVVIDKTQHWNKGGVLKVSIRLKVPGERLYVAIVEEEGSSVDLVYAAVRMAFDEVERQLKKQHKKNYRVGV